MTRTQGGIYAIRHVVSGKMYIGSAKSFVARWAVHRCDLKKESHHSRHLQRAWSRHGAEAFVFEILEVIEDDAALVRVEQDYLDRLQPWRRTIGYNMNRVAGSCLGRPVSAATRAKIAASHTGEKHTEEQRANNAAAQKNRSPEIKSRMAAIARATCQNPEVRAKNSAANKGKKRSPESLLRMSAGAKKHRAELDPEERARRGAANSAAKKGKPLSAERRAQLKLIMQRPEVREKLSIASKGGRLTPEHRASISAATKGKKPSSEALANRAAALRSPEVRAKISEGLRRRKEELLAAENEAANRQMPMGFPE